VDRLQIEGNSEILVVCHHSTVRVMVPPLARFRRYGTWFHRDQSLRTPRALQLEAEARRGAKMIYRRQLPAVVSETDLHVHSINVGCWVP